MLGVPGYAEATFTPASKAPRAIASFPESSRISSFFLLRTDTGPPFQIMGIEYQNTMNPDRFKGKVATSPICYTYFL